MYTIKDEVVYEQIINKSRFICYLFPVNNLEEVNDNLSAIKKKHYDATHNCYAYILGDGGQIAKNSDDGEPSQTAGVVIYEVLKKNNLTNVLAIVTRYFGGIKLGAGGLIRAYGSSTAKGLELAEIIKIEKYLTLTINFDYQYMNQISNLVSEYELIDKIFHEKVHLKVLVPEDNYQNLMEQLVDITKNTIIIKVD